MKPYDFTEEQVKLIKQHWVDPQGRLLLELIINDIAGMFDLADGEGLQALGEHNGRRWVAAQLARAVNTDIETFQRKENERTGPPTATERRRNA